MRGSERPLCIFNESDSCWRWANYINEYASYPHKRKKHFGICQWSYQLVPEYSWQHLQRYAKRQHFMLLLLEIKMSHDILLMCSVQLDPKNSPAKCKVGIRSHNSRKNHVGKAKKTYIQNGVTKETYRPWFQQIRWKFQPVSCHTTEK